MVKWKIILAMLGIFVAGAATGAFVALGAVKKMAERRGLNQLPAPWSPQQLRRMSEALGLSDEQVKKIRPIIRRNMEDMGRLRQFTAGEMRRNLERMEREISAELTPEQQGRFREMQELMRKRVLERRPGGPEGGPGRHMGPDERRRPDGELPPPPRDGERKPPGGG
jgi:Spy/CpxP family protein refolding chaperone